MQTNRLNYPSCVTGPKLFVGRGFFPDQENHWPKLASKSTSNKLLDENRSSSSKLDSSGTSLHPARNSTIISIEKKDSIVEELNVTKLMLKSSENVADSLLQVATIRNLQDEKILKNLSSQINLLTSAKSAHENELKDLRKSRGGILKELEESRKKIAEMTAAKNQLEQTLQRTDYLLDSKICAISSLSGQITHLGQVMSEQHQNMLHMKNCLSKLDSSTQPSSSTEANGHLATSARRVGLFVRGGNGNQQPQAQQRDVNVQCGQAKPQEGTSLHRVERRLRFSPPRKSSIGSYADQASDCNMETKSDDKEGVPTSSDPATDLMKGTKLADGGHGDDSLGSSLSNDGLYQPDSDTEGLAEDDLVDNIGDFKWMRNRIRETLISKAGGSGLRMDQIINSSKISPALRQALYRVVDYISSALAGHECARSISASFIQDIKLLCKQWPDLDVFCAIFESQVK